MSKFYQYKFLVHCANSSCMRLMKCKFEVGNSIIVRFLFLNYLFRNAYSDGYKCLIVNEEEHR